MTALATLHTDADRFAHQEGALRFIAERPGTLLDAGMSAGKTAIYLRAAEQMDAQRVLVLCPLAVLGVFPREVRKHSTREWVTWNGEVQGARGPLVNPSVARRAEAIVKATREATLLRRPLMVCVNYDACWRGDMARLLRGTDWDLLVLDESHRIKAPGGKASKLLQLIGAEVRARGGKVIGGSGTVTPRDELDLYAQLRAIDPSRLGTSFSRVKARYGAPKVKFVYGDGTPGYLTAANGQIIYEGLREDRRDEFAERVGQVIYRISQEEIDAALGLDEPVDLYRTIALDPATRRAYDALERDQIAMVADGVITAANAMVNVLRLAQAANGFGTDAENPDRVLRLADPPEKARLLADVLEDIPAHEPVVVFARFRHDLAEIEKVAAKVGRSYGELSGRRRDGLTADSEMADVDLLACQIQSGGTGIDLTRSHTGIYYSLDFNLGDYLQSRKRLHRHGQQHVVTFVHLLAENTVDRAIYGALRKRQDTLRAFLDYMKGATP